MPVDARYGTVPGVRRLLDRDSAEDADPGDEPTDPAEPADPDGDQEYADRDTAAALPATVLAERINTAANQVDAALAPYYRVPFVDEVPGLVVDITEAIAAYLATLTHVQSDDLDEKDPVRLRYAWAMGQLEAIARGTAGLPGQARTTPASTGHGAMGAPRNPHDGRMFTPGTFGLATGRERGADATWDVR